MKMIKSINWKDTNLNDHIEKSHILKEKLHHWKRRFYSLSWAEQLSLRYLRYLHSTEWVISREKATGSINSSKQTIGS